MNRNLICFSFSVSLSKNSKWFIITIDVAADNISKTCPYNAYIAEQTHLIISTPNIYLAHIMCQVMCLGYVKKKKRTKTQLLTSRMSPSNWVDRKVKIITKPFAIRIILLGKNKCIFISPNSPLAFKLIPASLIVFILFLFFSIFWISSLYISLVRS